MRNRTFIVVFVSFVLLYSGQMATLDRLPMIDLPYQLAAATIYQSHDTPDNQFAAYYTVNVFPTPNVAHVLFCSATLWPSVEAANRIYFCLYALLLPLATLVAIRRRGGDPWFALLAFVFLFNYSYSWGFVGFTMAVPFVLFTQEVLTRLAEKPSWPYRFLLACLLLVLFWLHVLAALLAVVMIVLHAVLLSRTAPRRATMDFVSLAPITVMLTLWLTAPGGLGATLSMDMWEYYRTDYLPTWWRRAGLLAWDNFALFGNWVGVVVAAGFAVFSVHFALVGWLQRFRAGRWRVRVQPAHLMLVVAVAAYLILPRTVPGTAHLYERFAVFVLVALVIHGSCAAAWKPRWSRIAIVVVCVLHLALWTHYHTSFQREAASFGPEVLPEADAHPLAALIFDADFRGRPIYQHFQDYFTVWKRGIAVSKVGDYPYYPVTRQAASAGLPGYMEWVGKWERYDGRYGDMRWLLVRGGVPRDVEPHLGDFVNRRASGPWTLYENVANHE